MAKKKPIISPLGQWAYPGEVTIIPSSKITMKGVNYPVLGVDDFGNSKVMMPGAEYEFPGNYVTEYPQMGKGGEMIKRKDGSYSKRGLWDNIRANKGSGKKPTKQMLEQERKIKAKMQDGGWLNNYQTAGEVSSEQNPERMNPIEIQTKKDSWYERYPRMAWRPIDKKLHDFGSQYAQRISDATGGADWYKQSNPFMNLAFETMNIPQYAAMHAITGKVQRPSEAMDIQNPYGAMAVDMLLDPIGGPGLVKGLAKGAPIAAKFLTTKTALKNAYKLNPNAVSKLGEFTRVVGKDAIDDLAESGLIRTGEGAKSKIGEISVARPTAYPSFGKGSPKETYLNQVIRQGDEPFVISTNRPMKASTLGRHGKGTTMFPVDETGNYMKSFPASEADVFHAEPHWLKGYKPVTASSSKTVPIVNNFSKFDELTPQSMDDIYHRVVNSPGYSDDVQKAIDYWQEYKHVSPELDKSFTLELGEDLPLTRRLKTPLAFDENGYVINSGKPISFSAGLGNDLLGQHRVHLMAPKGTKVSPISRAASSTTMQGEREILFPTTSKFKKLHSRVNPQTGLEDYIIGLEQKNGGQTNWLNKYK